MQTTLRIDIGIHRSGSHYVLFFYNPCHFPTMNVCEVRAELFEQITKELDRLAEEDKIEPALRKNVF